MLQNKSFVFLIINICRQMKGNTFCLLQRLPCLKVRFKKRVWYCKEFFSVQRHRTSPATSGLLACIQTYCEFTVFRTLQKSSTPLMFNCLYSGCDKWNVWMKEVLLLCRHTPYFIIFYCWYIKFNSYPHNNLICKGLCNITILLNHVNYNILLTLSR